MKYLTEIKTAAAAQEDEQDGKKKSFDHYLISIESAVT